VSNVVFVSEGAVTENAEEGVAAASVARLSDADVLGQVGHEVRVRLVDDELALGLSADEAVRQYDLTLRNRLLPVGRLNSNDLFGNVTFFLCH